MECARFCRLCLFSGRGLLEVFDNFTSDGTALNEVIRDLLNLTVMQNNMLPCMICQSCVFQLQEFLRFKTRCMRSKLVLDSMFSIGTNGAITSQSSSFKRKEVDGLKFKEVEKRKAEKKSSKDSILTKDDSSSKEQCRLQGTSCADSILSNYLEEREGDEIDAVVEFCWCQECGNEFLSHKELKAHLQWCKGVETFVWHPADKDFEQEELATVNSLYSMKQPLFDPSICCGKCRRVFKTKGHLIRHINKHDFKCKPKDSHASVNLPETVDGGRESKLICCANDFSLIEKQNKSCVLHEGKQGNDHGLTKGNNGLPEHKQFKLHSKQRTIGKGLDTLTANRVQNIVRENKLTYRSIGEDSIPKDQNPSSCHDLTKNTFDGGSNVCCPVCGIFPDSEYLVAHLTNCSIKADEKSNTFFDPVRRECVESNSISLKSKVQSRVQMFEAVNDLNSAKFSCGNSVSGGKLDAQLGAFSNLIDKTRSFAVEVVLYICNYCEKTYSTKPDLRNHIVKCHLSMNPQTCTVCHRLFSNSEELEEHSRLHPKGKKFYCTVCGECFRFRIDLRKHATGVHGAKKAFICSLCFNGFISKSDVGLHHSLVHTAFQKPFKCNKCARCYSDKRYYDLHVNICQLNAILFKCNICGKCQTSRANLANHHLMHSRKRQFACPMCPKFFLLSGHRNTHLRTAHWKIKPFECEICNKRFCIKSRLNAHYVVHSDFRPFHCPECPKSFKEKHNLKMHLSNIHNVT